MNVYTVTLLHHNYGSVLQAFALQNYIKSQGSNPLIIFNSEDLVESNPPCYPIRVLRALWVYLKPEKHYSTYKRLKILLQKKKFRPKEEKLRSFIRTNINVLNIENISVFLDSASKSDIFLAGSDQIWNIIDRPLSSWLSLDWVDNRFSKFSYAASIGLEYLSKEQIESYRKGLSGYKTISFREKQAVNLLKPVLNCTVRQDVDPTILFDKIFWKKYESERLVKEPYIFVYMLRPDKNVIKLATRLSTNLHCKVIYTGLMADNYSNVSTVCDAGIEEFLSYIDNAEMIITNSFHGTVFSILFEKKFLTINVASTSSRMRSFLDLVNLSSQFITDINDKFSLDIDYNKVTPLVEKARKDSRAYLQSILQ